MIKLLIALFFAVYALSIAQSVFRFFNLNRIINILSAYLNSAEPELTPSGRALHIKPIHEERLEDVRRLIPSMNEYLNSNTYCDIEYMEDSVTTYSKAINTYKELRMVRNYVRRAVFLSLNPLNALKALVSFPSKIIKFIGFKPKQVTSRILNILGWIITFLSVTYRDEIKQIIDSIFDKLTGA